MPVVTIKKSTNEPSLLRCVIPHRRRHVFVSLQHSHTEETVIITVSIYHCCTLESFVHISNRIFCFDVDLILVLALERYFKFVLFPHE